MSNDIVDAKTRKQIKELHNHQKGIEERKLLIIEVQKDRYRLDGGNKEWKLSNSLYTTYANEESNFQIILLGLDGGIKLREFDIVKTQDVFNLIDSMPMRKSELRKMKNQK